MKIGAGRCFLQKALTRALLSDDMKDTKTNFLEIVRAAWDNYDAWGKIKRITDISVRVSTNYVYKVEFENRGFVIAKLSYFGKFEHFKEDHTIINSLSNNLPFPYDNFLSRSLMLGTETYVYRHQNAGQDVWVVFYRPVKVRKKLPPRLTPGIIVKLGAEAACFHKACHAVRNTLPKSTKTFATDTQDLADYLDTDAGIAEHGANRAEIKRQCDLLLRNTLLLNSEKLVRIPVFTDWNIGNFSVTQSYRFFSRWDYDWFRTSSRMMDFYFFSRVVSNVGDRPEWTYNIEPMQEERFLLFLKSYHSVFPLTATEIHSLREVYRFFILNYVIKEGRYFFHDKYAAKFQAEAIDRYFPSIEAFDSERLVHKLGLK